MKIGIIGTGIMGTFHAQCLHESISGATVSAIADPNLTRGREVADAVGAIALADPLELIQHPDVDAVLIASPDAFRAAQTLACVEAGKPALCEKPLSYSVAEAEQVVKAHREATDGGVPLVYQGFMRRFDPGYVAQKGAISSGEYGKALMVHSIGRGVTSGPGATDESVIFNSAIHDLDIVPWLLDSPVTSVSWLAPENSSSNTDLHEPFLMLLRTADGGLSTVEIYLNARYGYDMRSEVVCENGVISITEPHRVAISSELATKTAIPDDFRPRFADAYRLELQEWVDALNEGRAATLATVEDGAVATRVAAAAVASMQQHGAFINVKDVK
ncbi:Gfo/Idh/MocA family protein [Gulosibacter chungangensis]|uniref:Gfo/Idh/MocA family protein n=1 Tax=Gulosibacter chungangensis TaxID=979746 RepID=UPI0017881535|nr:Gfo/Idh/MocA family oxidoreductase [Gulosibacter chungangensis]